MGGTASGDVAASRAAQTTLNYLRQHAATIQKVSSGHASPDKLIALAQSAVQEANSAIHSHTIEHAELRGSGTTIVLLITAGDNGVCAHVGDSRLYAFRNNQLLQLTTLWHRTYSTGVCLKGINYTRFLLNMCSPVRSVFYRQFRLTPSSLRSYPATDFYSQVTASRVKWLAPHLKG